MKCKEPSSVEDLVYFTNRTLNDSKGSVKAWVYKLECPQCKKDLMSKPINPKTKKPKVRASYYECKSCHHTMEKSEVEPLLKVEVKYICPMCQHEGCAIIPFKRKKFKGVDAFIFNCEKCNEKIPITKKMKVIKPNK